MGPINALRWSAAWRRARKAYGGYTNSAQAAARFRIALSSSGPVSRRYRAEWATAPPATRVSASAFLANHRAQIGHSLAQSLAPLG